MSEKYREIINMPRHEPEKHPRMPISERSAQFAPYAALSGYDAVVRERGRLTSKRPTLDEYETEELNRQMQKIAERETDACYKITYFVADRKKKGGRCIEVIERIKRIDSIQKIILTDSELIIPIEDIISIEEIRYES